jgi:hypothetical protein
VVIHTLEHINNRKDKLLLGGECSRSSVVTLDQWVYWDSINSPMGIQIIILLVVFIITFYV